MRAGGSTSRRNAGLSAAELDAAHASPPERPPQRPPSPIVLRARAVEGAAAVDMRESDLDRASTVREEMSTPGLAAASEFFKDLNLDYIMQPAPKKPTGEAQNPSLEGALKKIVDSRKPKLVSAASLQAFFKHKGLQLTGDSFSEPVEQCFTEYVNDALTPTGFNMSELCLLSLDGSCLAHGVSPFQGAASNSANAIPVVKLRPSASMASTLDSSPASPHLFLLSVNHRFSALSKLSEAQKKLVGLLRSQLSIPETVYLALHEIAVESYKSFLNEDSVLTEAALIHGATRAHANNCLFLCVCAFLESCDVPWMKTLHETELKNGFGGYDDPYCVPTPLLLIMDSHYRLASNVGARAMDALRLGFNSSADSFRLDDLSVLFSTKFPYGKKSIFSFLGQVKELTARAAHNCKAPPGTPTLPGAVQPQHPATTEPCGIQAFVAAVSAQASNFNPQEKREWFIVLANYEKGDYPLWAQLCVRIEQLQREGHFPGADTAVTDNSASAPMSYAATSDKSPQLDNISPQNIEQYASNLNIVRELFSYDKKLLYSHFEKLTVPGIAKPFKILTNDETTNPADRKPLNARDLWEATKSIRPPPTYVQRQALYDVIGACRFGTPKYLPVIHNADKASDRHTKTKVPGGSLDSSSNRGQHRSNSAKSAEAAASVKAKEHEAMIEAARQAALEVLDAKKAAERGKGRSHDGGSKRDFHRAHAGKGGKGGKSRGKGFYSATEDFHAAGPPAGAFFAGGGQMMGYGMSPFSGPPPPPFGIHSTPFVGPPPTPDQFRQMQQFSLQQQMMMQRQMPPSSNTLALTAAAHDASGGREDGRFAQSGAPSGVF